jgi:hypothetical protein
MCVERDEGEDDAYCNTAIALQDGTGPDYKGVALLGHGCHLTTASFAPASADMDPAAAAAAGYVSNAERECSDLLKCPKRILQTGVTAYFHLLSKVFVDRPCQIPCRRQLLLNPASHQLQHPRQHASQDEEQGRCACRRAPNKAYQAV